MPNKPCVVCGQFHDGRAFVYLAKSATLSNWAVNLGQPQYAFKIGSAFDLRCRRSGLNGKVKSPCLGLNDWIMDHAWLCGSRTQAYQDENRRRSLAAPFQKLKPLLLNGTVTVDLEVPESTNGESEIFVVPLSFLENAGASSTPFGQPSIVLRALVYQQLTQRMRLRPIPQEQAHDESEPSEREIAFREQVAEIIELQDYFAEAAESGWPEP